MKIILVIYVLKIYFDSVNNLKIHAWDICYKTAQGQELNCMVCFYWIETINRDFNNTHVYLLHFVFLLTDWYI